MLRNPSITFLTWILRTWPPRDRSPPTTPTNPMYGSLLRNCSFVNIKSYSTVWNFVLSSPLRFRHLYQCMNLKEYVVQHLTDSSLELEFRTPLFFLIWPLPRLWYGSLSGSISLSHLSIFYNISCYNSLVLLTFVSRSSCRLTLKNLKRHAQLNLETKVHHRQMRTLSLFDDYDIITKHNSVYLPIKAT